MITLHLGDCLEVLGTLEENSVDTVITDPPYELGFMGKKWDGTGVSFQKETWKAVLRVAKPGATMLCFGGTRTWHRLACAAEDAGWQIRDTCMFLYGSGFPKSLSISKQLDKQERDKWLKVEKATYDINKHTVMVAWKENSRTAKSAGLLFAKNGIGTGMNTPKSDFVLGNAMLSINPKKSSVNAIIAELSLNVPHHIYDKRNGYSVPENVDISTYRSKPSAEFVVSKQPCLEVGPAESIIVPVNVWGWQSGNTMGNLKAVEALRIWLGSKKSSRTQTINVLCAALTDDLKHIILSQSKTFQTFDTIQQMECVSAMNVIITESTAEHLISFMVDMLRSKAIDKAKGAKRKVVGKSRSIDCIERGYTKEYSTKAENSGYGTSRQFGLGLPITAPATDLAKQWNGWGSSLKPAWEPILVCMKPLDGTYAENAEKHGVAGLNIDGGRIEIQGNPYKQGFRKGIYVDNYEATSWRLRKNGIPHTKLPHTQGRWPANLILSHSLECRQVGEQWECAEGCPVRMLDEQSGELDGRGNKGPSISRADVYGFTFVHSCGGEFSRGDSGGASRFFYCAKASRKERNMGLNSIHTIKYNVGKSTLGGLLCKDVSMVLVAFLEKATSGSMVRWLIDESGESIMGLCPSDSLSTTLMGISKITESKISDLLMPLLTKDCIPDVNCGTGNGGSPAASVESSSKSQRTIISESQAGLVRGVKAVALPMLSIISDAANWKPLTNTHSTVKPLALLDYLCKLTKTPTGGIVLDPFMGSGTTGIAAIRMGRKFIGIEKDKESFEIAKMRIEAAKPEAEAIRLGIKPENHLPGIKPLF